jgi:spermidine/putrescine transport system substrate-binding protein
MGSNSDGAGQVDRAETRISRRQFLVGSAALAAIPILGSSVLSACGGSSTSSDGSASVSPSAAANPTGTAVLLNFPGWLGASELENFRKQFPGADIKESTNIPSSISGVVQLIKNSPGAYDIALGDNSFVGQAKAADIWQQPDWSLVPNIKNVDQKFRDAYPDALPNDWGLYGIGYRKDMVKEPLTSWADFWKLVPKYDGQVVVGNVDRGTIGVALKYLGYSVNSKDPAEIDAATNALIEIKPYLQAITSLNIAQGLAKGTIAFALCGNWDTAPAMAENDNVAWVVPSDGTPGYVEGFVALKPSEHLDVVHAFLNFHMDPVNYADFVNSTSSSWVSSAADQYIKPELLDSKVLKLTPEELALVEMTQYLGEATPLYGKAWEEFKAA